jgi:hypothetical protein
MRNSQNAYILDSEMQIFGYGLRPKMLEAARNFMNRLNVQYRFTRLLIVLSENSLKSEWVMTEIRKARRIEGRESRRKLFPIRLVDFETICDWECFDADSGKDLASEVREYFIPDFSNWKDYDSFEIAFDRLLRDLKPQVALQLIVVASEQPVSC